MFQMKSFGLVSKAARRTGVFQNVPKCLLLLIRAVAIENGSSPVPQLHAVNDDDRVTNRHILLTQM
jgi:hypothetical protein